MLAALALHAPSPVDTGRLADTIWGDNPPRTARKALHTYVATLRRRVGGTVETTESGYRLADGVAVDVSRFEQEANAAARLIAQDPGAALERAASAIELAAGEPFADLGDNLDAGIRRTAIHERVAWLEECRAEALIRTGSAPEAVAELEAMVAALPYRERRWWLLMIGLYRNERRTESLRALTRARSALEEIGLDPGDELRDLESAVLSDDATLRDDSIFLTGRGRADTSRPPWGLPPTEGSFVGRDDEMAALRRILHDNPAVVTVVGGPGVGKTRLAVETARTLGDTFPDGIWFVPLSGVPAGSDAAPAMLDRLGISLGVSNDAERAIESWRRSRRALVVLDTCERVAASVSALVRSTCDASATTPMLLTSRRALDLPGERLLRLGPLPTTASSHDNSPAVDLFFDRMAGASDLGPEGVAAVSRICRRLGGVPLAVELAAARTSSMAPREVEERLGELDHLLRDTGGGGRHASLSDAIEWSVALLDDHTRLLFDRLSVFVGGCTLDAAQEVCGLAPVGRWGVIDGLDRLVKHSLVELRPDAYGGGRYWMLDTVRGHAARRLESAGEAAALRGRMARQMTSFAEAAFVGSRTSAEGQWAAQVQDELPNVRASHDHLLDVGDTEAQTLLISPLINYSVVQAVDELLEMAARTVAAVNDERPSALVRTLAMATWREARRQDHAAAAALASRAHGLAGADPAADAEVLHMRAIVAYFSGDFVTGRALNVEGAAVARGGGDRHGEALNLGLIVQLYGMAHPGGMHELADRVLELAESVGAPSLLAWAYYTWGLSRQADDPALALAWFERSARCADSVGALFYGDLVRRSTTSVLTSLDPETALRVGVRTLRSQMASGEVFQVGLSVPWFVTMLTSLDRHEAAIVFEEATYRFGDRITSSFNPEGRRRAMRRCEEALGPERVEAARLAGRTIDLPGLVDYAESVLNEIGV